jgi:hypothetical protein
MVVLFSGCQLYNEATDYYYLNHYIEKTELFKPDDFLLRDINHFNDITNYINEKIQFSNKYDKWRSVEEILESGKGNCKDFCLVYINLYFIKFEQKLNILFVNDSRKIENGGSVNHSIIQLDDKQFCPQKGQFESYNIGYSYSFNDLFY